MSKWATVQMHYRQPYMTLVSAFWSIGSDIDSCLFMNIRWYNVIDGTSWNSVSVSWRRWNELKVVALLNKRESTSHAKVEIEST